MNASMSSGSPAARIASGRLSISQIAVSRAAAGASASIMCWSMALVTEIFIRCGSSGPSMGSQ
jgi:hypothetical protein